MKPTTTTEKTTKAERVSHNLDKFANGKQLIKNNMWYGIIALLTVIVLVIFPMISSGLPLALTFPTTPAGWVIYVATKLAMAVINICIFHAFMEQGKLNVSEFWKKKIADEILHRIKQQKMTVPLSPEEWLAKEYRNKGISIAITTILSCVVLSQIVLSFDIIVFLGYLVALSIGVIFGVGQLYKAEHFWSMDYYDYAIYVMNQHNLTRPPELQVSVRNKSLYEGENLIYEYE